MSSPPTPAKSRASDQSPDKPPLALALSDAQITCVMQLSRPLLPDQRVAFVELLAAKLNGHREIGDGTLYQLCRDLQRELFSPPLETEPRHRHVGKYAR
jgi:hypothetical protein